MSISVEFPDTLLLASRDEPDVFSHKVMIYTLGHLYAEGKISRASARKFSAAAAWSSFACSQARVLTP